jgi:CRISPR/Cas system-associated protein endoribonuclease Cas2
MEMKRIVNALVVFAAFSVMAGCSTGMDAVDKKINQVKEAADTEVKAQLQTAIQKQFDQLKAGNSQFAAALAQKDKLKVDWEALKNTELARHSFFSAFGYEYLAKIRGDGTVQVVQRNTNTGEEKVYKEYQITIDGNNQVQLQ